MTAPRSHSRASRCAPVVFSGLVFALLGCERSGPITSVTSSHRAAEVAVSENPDMSDAEIVDAIVALFPVTDQARVRQALLEDRVAAIGGSNPKLQELLKKRAALRAARPSMGTLANADPFDLSDPELRRRDKERLMRVTIALVSSLERQNDRVAVTADPSDFRQVLIRIRRDGATPADVDAGMAVARAMAEGVRTGTKPNRHASSIRSTSRIKGTEMAGEILSRLVAMPSKPLADYGLAQQIQVVTHSKDPRKP